MPFGGNLHKLTHKNNVTNTTLLDGCLMNTVLIIHTQLPVSTTLFPGQCQMRLSTICWIILWNAVS